MFAGSGAVHLWRVVAPGVRVLGLVVAPVVLFALAGLVAEGPGDAIIDVWFAAAVTIVLSGRLFEVPRFEARSPTGAALVAHFWSYSDKLIVAITSGWLIAHRLR